MLKIWGRPNSVNVQKVMWCVAELGLDHERIDAGMQFGLNDQDWYRAMNPNGLIPVIDDGGLVLWESNAIVRYLAATYGAGTLCPAAAAERATADQWMDWQATTLGVPMGPVFMGLIRTPAAQRDMGAIDAATVDCNRLFGLLDQHLDGRTYMLGDNLTMADIPIGAMTYRWYGLDVPHADHPNLRAWYDRLATRPTFQEHVMIPLS